MPSDGINFKISLKELEKVTKGLKRVESQVQASIERLAMAAFNQAVAITREKLKDSTNQDLFLQNLKLEKTSDGTFDAYLIVIKKEVMWLEEGSKGYSLKDTLKGDETRIIPFNHNKNKPSNMSQQQKTLYNEVKMALKQNNIPMKQPIVDSSGRPIISTPNRPKVAAMIKKVPSSKSGSASGESVLNRLHIYQSQQGSSINKTFLTFRTLSKNSPASWQIPPRDALKILDQVYTWLMANYERILNQNLRNLQISLA